MRVNALLLVGLPLAEALRLFNSGICPFAQRPWIALLETQTSFEHALIDLRDKPEAFLALSPTGKVPLLEPDDGNVISESVEIARHIAHTYKADEVDLLPASRAPEIESFVKLWTESVEPAYYAVLGAESEDEARFGCVGLMESLQAVEDRLWMADMKLS